MPTGKPGNTNRIVTTATTPRAASWRGAVTTAGRCRARAAPTPASRTTASTTLAGRLHTRASASRSDDSATTAATTAAPPTSSSPAVTARLSIARATLVGRTDGLAPQAAL